MDRTDRLCLVCKLLDCVVEDEQQFVFDCPVYNYIRSCLIQSFFDCMLYLTQYRALQSVYPWEHVSEIQSIKGTISGHTIWTSCCTVVLLQTF